MQAELQQEDIDIYATEGSRQKPDEYAQGVKVGWTAPAKWWNWLWNRLTGMLTQHKSDMEAIHTEAVNILNEVGYNPSSASSHQVSKSINKVAIEEVENVVEEPYVEGHKVIIPLGGLN